MRNQKKVKVFIILILLFYCFNNTMNGQVPINDSPCISDANPPYDLGTSGSHTGTTCNAVGYNDDPDADRQNVECNSISDDNAVWYRVTYNSDYDGVNINIMPGTIGNNTAVEVYVGGADAICDSTAQFRKAKCDGLPVVDMYIGCLEEGDYVWIKITSSDGDCGTFDISVNYIEDCIGYDNCKDIKGYLDLNPVTPVDTTVNYECRQGCLYLACPDTIEGGCDFSQNPTVWYQVITDAKAEQLYTTVTTSGSWTPIWSVWHPEPDCDNLVNAGDFAGSFPCSSQSTPPDLLVVPVQENETYYISLTADPDGKPIDDPNFQICVATTEKVNICNDDLSVEWKITDRENKAAEPEGPPYQGPFCHGEELSVHISFHYDATETGDNWLLGLIPKFGCGWDVDDFDFNTNAPQGNGRTAKWYTEEGDCPPQIMEDVGYLCTYKDSEGRLRLVNTLFEVIPPGVTCSNGLNKYDTLPSGYFWAMEGGSPDCDKNNCSPSRKYGIGTPVTDVVWDFKMKVKELNYNCTDCNDLNIVFQIFSDELAGCWDDPRMECIGEKIQFSPNWEVNCKIPAGVVAQPQSQEVCTGAKLDLLLYSNDGNQKTIEVTYEENPNVTGESEHIFEGGSGTIDDILSIGDPEACDPETVIYYAQVFENDYICGSKIDTIEVLVFPEPIFKINKQDIPYGEENTGSASVSTSCPDSNFTYLWSTGDTTDMISGLSEGSYIVTITSIYGCSTIDSVQIITLGACGGAEFIKNDISCFGECTGSAGIENILYGLPPFSYYWSTGDTISSVDSLCEGMYFVTIMDADSCVFLDSIEIVSPLSFNLLSEVIDAKCYGECNGAIVINNVENAVAPVSYLWDNGDTTYYHINICAGDYHVTITDSTGCMFIDTFTINQPDEILIFVDTVINITNSGAGSIFTHSNNNGNYIFNWTGPDGYQADEEYISGLNKAGCYTLIVTDTVSNCTADTTICISDKTGIIDINDKSNIKIYPNPADNIVYFDLDESTISHADIRIYNIAGIEINRFEIDQGNEVYKLNAGNIAQGLYIVKVLSVKGVEIETFIINR